MKRMHIHIAVNELPKSIGFYSAMFDSAPTVERHDYAKWQLDNPKVNFAISLREGVCGMNHLGIQVDSEAELKEIAQRLDSAEIDFSSQQGISCCGSHSNKHWVLDPQGIAWESFRTLSTSPMFDEHKELIPEESSACCIPLHLDASKPQKADCCVPNKNDASGCCS